MTEIQYQKRIRVEVSTSVKGIHTYSSTIEMLDTDQEQVLAESDRLIKALDGKYPPAIEKEK